MNGIEKRWTRWTIARVATAVVAGGAAGYAYYATIGCMSGTCPLTSNPWLTTAMGAFVAGSIAWPAPTRSPRGGDGKAAGTGPEGGDTGAGAE